MSGLIPSDGWNQGQNQRLREGQLYFPKEMHGRLTCMKVPSNHPDF